MNKKGLGTFWYIISAIIAVIVLILVVLALFTYWQPLKGKIGRFVSGVIISDEAIDKLKPDEFKLLEEGKVESINENVEKSFDEIKTEIEEGKEYEEIKERYYKLVKICSNPDLIEEYGYKCGQLVEILYDLAESQFKKGESDKSKYWVAIGDYKELIDVYSSRGNKKDEIWLSWYPDKGEDYAAKALIGIAKSYEKLERYEDAIDYYGKFLNYYPDGRAGITTLQVESYLKEAQRVNALKKARGEEDLEAMQKQMQADEEEDLTMLERYNKAYYEFNTKERPDELRKVIEEFDKLINLYRSCVENYECNPLYVAPQIFAGAFYWKGKTIRKMGGSCKEVEEGFGDLVKTKLFYGVRLKENAQYAVAEAFYELIDCYSNEKNGEEKQEEYFKKLFDDFSDSKAAIIIEKRYEPDCLKIKYENKRETINLCNSKNNWLRLEADEDKLRRFKCWGFEFTVKKWWDNLKIFSIKNYYCNSCEDEIMYSCGSYLSEQTCKANPCGVAQQGYKCTWDGEKKECVQIVGISRRETTPKDTEQQEPTESGVGGGDVGGLT